MNALVDWLLQPLGLFALLWSLSLLGWAAGGARPRLPFALGLAGFAVLWLASAPLVANALVHRVESARAVPPECAFARARDDPLVVLGGGLDRYVDSDSPYEILDRDSLLRVSKAVEIAGDDARFYLIGGESHARKPSLLMAAILADRGVAPERIIVETGSESTADNARALVRLLPPEETPRITLVTSALHLPRAAASLERHGYTVCHAAADTLYSEAALPVSLLPYLAGLEKSTRAAHELLALVLYRLRSEI